MTHFAACRIQSVKTLNRFSRNMGQGIQKIRGFPTAGPREPAISGRLRPNLLDFNNNLKGLTMADFGNDGGLWTARLLGASAGAAVSLIYLLPRSRREAACRFFTGLACGLVFGGPAGRWIAVRLGIASYLGPAEVLLTGSAAASLSAWWGLGVLARLAERLRE